MRRSIVVFFQAEDGIRDIGVTGVQTCALPILPAEVHMLAETEDYARFLGWTGSGIGSVSCDQGAAEALGFDPDDHRVAVYFDSAARAQEFVAGYDRQDVGSAQVTTYCLD